MSLLIFTDAGVNGGSVSYDPQAGKVCQSHKWKTDELFIEWVKSQGKVTTAFVELLTGYQEGRHRMVSSKAFIMGDNYGFQRGVFKALGIDLKMLTPQRWQTGLRVRGKTYEAKKKALKELAVQRWPNHKVTNATCDAYLMADWHYRAYGAGDVGL